MNPTILHDLTKAHTSDLHRQAGRDALSRSYSRLVSGSTMPEGTGSRVGCPGPKASWSRAR